MKNKTISIKNLPKELYHPNTIKIKIYEYVTKHPKCIRKEMYNISDEGTIRRNIREMINQGLLKEEFCGCGVTKFLEINGCDRK